MSREVGETLRLRSVENPTSRKNSQKWGTPILVSPILVFPQLPQILIAALRASPAS